MDLPDGAGPCERPDDEHLAQVEPGPRQVPRERERQRALGQKNRQIETDRLDQRHAPGEETHGDVERHEERDQQKEEGDRRFQTGKAERRSGRGRVARVGQRHGAVTRPSP